MHQHWADTRSTERISCDVVASSGTRQGDHVRLLAEGKDSVQRLEQTDSDARRQNGHGEARAVLIN